MKPTSEVVGRDIIVIGASAGGVNALCEVIEYLPPDLPAAVFVVLHLAPHGRSALPSILGRSGCLPACHPSPGEPIEPGRIYIAPPDHHLAIDGDRVLLSRNASENGHRPAIDVLFRTAARAFGPRVVGVVLTGNLDDGTDGLAAIKRCGGAAVVQDPDEADYPSMPESAIANVPVDHVLPLGDIGPILDRLAREPRPAIPADCGTVEEEPYDMGANDKDTGGPGPAGQPSGFTCPDCGGSLYERPGEQPLHFRCRTGHAFSPESLLAKQSDCLDAALWAALRSLEENAAMARRMAKRAREHDNEMSRRRYERRAHDAEGHAKLLRSMLETGGVADELMSGTG
ncbi:MAG TPA: chemotaxis protein CheB [Thermoanaerobaculia bacterium]|jgi:two-component system chemotaxis response regulator CheB|nr:chemotaxis protein CheB [Thermoanaerobaculia bacterium]